MFNAVVVGADLVATELLALAVAQQTKEAAIVGHFGAMYQAAVKAHASGRPGPRAITGDYRRSITLDLVRTPTGTAAIVGTDRPQARRLEFGFAGVDSRGRHYNQPPFPHFEPPLAGIVDQLAAALNAAVLAGV